jgi:hypothetical protein
MKNIIKTIVLSAVLFAAQNYYLPAAIYAGSFGNAGDTVSSAKFTVAGEPGYTYTITLADPCAITDANGRSITMNGLTSEPSGIGYIATNGSQVLHVEAILDRIAGQMGTNYRKCKDVSVTVSYN